MQTRKDLYQAHRLMTQRLGMALLQAQPDVPESPMRRQNVATFAGVLIAVLLLAGFGIWGMLKSGGATKLTDPGQLLVEDETGAAYVYSQKERKLLPVANYVSGRLLLDVADVKVRNVSAASLADFQRAPLVGIPGAPNSLPVKDKMVHGPWAACVTEGKDAAGGSKPYVTLVGGADVGGRPLGSDAMAVLDEQMRAWIIWADRRMRISAEGLRALGAGTPRKVPAPWLNAIPQAPVDFRAPTIENRGRAVSGGRIGQVFTTSAVAGGQPRWYVLVADGYAQITSTQATLLLSDPETKKAYGRRRADPIQTDAATVNASPSKAQMMGGNLPENLPKVVPMPVGAPVCAVYADTAKGSTRARLTVGATIAIQTPRTSGGQDSFDQVLLPPGSAVLAGLLPGEGQMAAIGTYYLVTDQGRKFELKSADLIEKLGYDSSVIAPLPANLVHLIPDGPMLDPQAALAPLKVMR
ncbi:type VII secretion protein EccB [Nonomuraea sp. NPDC050383]|uniref:type VII secretion protein EccB n=1 Tax=Nonomuraea sp. NPDC050383 TaxID=3364362 RepID=UPI0037A656D9